MLTCEDCGCLVDPELTDKHQDFHDDLVRRSSLAKNGVANPDRTKWGDITVLPCNTND